MDHDVGGPRVDVLAAAVEDVQGLLAVGDDRDVDRRLEFPERLLVEPDRRRVVLDDQHARRVRLADGAHPVV